MRWLPANKVTIKYYTCIILDIYCFLYLGRHTTDKTLEKNPQITKYIHIAYNYVLAETIIYII